MVFKKDNESDVGPEGDGVTKGGHLYPVIGLYLVIGENTLASHPSYGFLIFFSLLAKFLNSKNKRQKKICKKIN